MTSHFMAYFGVIFFANMGGGGGQNYVHQCSTIPPNLGGESPPPPKFGGYGSSGSAELLSSFVCVYVCAEVLESSDAEAVAGPKPPPQPLPFDCGDQSSLYAYQQQMPSQLASGSVSTVVRPVLQTNPGRNEIPPIIRTLPAC